MSDFVRHRPLVGYAVLAYALSWLVWGLGLATAERPWQLDDPVLGAAILVGSFGPTVAALVMAGLLGGRVAVGRLLRTLLRVRAVWWVWLVLFFLPPTVVVLLYLVLGIEPAGELGLGAVVLTAVVAMPVNAVLGGVLLGAGPLGEELGWRGFALPRLVEPLGAVGASLVLGVLWAGWHAPLALVPDWRLASWAVFAVGYPLSLVALSLVLTAVWQWSHGSTLLAILGHAVLNSTASVASGDLYDLARFSPDELYLLVVASQWLIAAAVGLVAWLTSRRARDRTGAPAGRA